MSNLHDMTPAEIREVREKFGLTQKQMDARLGIGKGGVRDYERGKRAVPGPTALLLKLLLTLRDAKRTAAHALYEAFWG